MPTEITAHTAPPPTGWVFFDAECRFCASSRRRWGPIFERRGFVWLPLQTPGTVARLGVAPERLMAEMWLLPAGAPPLSGVQAWISLMQHVWWLKPFTAVLVVPGIKHLARVVYRWIARNRRGLGGQCHLPQRRPPNRHRHAAFLDLP